ncbi:hypothetical protein PS467_16105 [Streptomyces luomodiensis]|uniref:Uncharacterized protein n=1 Tax=Streptomyces luomodiensis TaxID=3026192 RepID=A0ABY9V3Y0_9ACTN|nr:hypothetical protein [Streptomyces sp. SCA4-21]WNE96744.1 hypothetical protein PS467_16105 [Streptomyces sp. SCA4-21]
MKREAGVDISRSRTTAQHPQRQDCDLVTVPARQGLEAVDILRRACDGLGPVLHDHTCDTLGFLVPPGTADGWDLPGSACTQTSGRGIRINIDSGAPGDAGAAGDAGGAEAEAAGDEAPPGVGTGWLVPPDAAYTVATDPAELRAALGEAARTIEAVDRCQ